MGKIKYILTIALLLSVQGIKAQNGNWLTDKVKSFGEHLDSSAVNKYNPLYIEVPERPWRIILRAKFDENIVDFINESVFNYDEEKPKTRLTMGFDSKVNKSIGLWMGYRGLGLGYYYKTDKNKNKDINLALSATAAKFGFNFRLRSMSTNRLHLRLDEETDGTTTSEEEDFELITNFDILSFYMNGYYVFNGNKYSQGAAYNQVVVQRKSAGSLLLGVTAYASSVGLNTDRLNAGIVTLADSLGYISLGKISLGLGYGYNWVPARGWTVNIMAMPNISISDNITTVKYDNNYDFFGTADVDDYGKWDSEKHVWQNGKTYKPSTINDKFIDWTEDIEMWESSRESHRTCMSLNIDLRMGIAYCWKRYFISANAIFNHYEYGRNHNRVDLIDWYAIASFGFRI